MTPHFLPPFANPLVKRSQKLFAIRSLFFCMLLVFSFKVRAQTPFFSPAGVGPESLSIAQAEIYNKAQKFGTYSNFQIVKVNALVDALHDDSLLDVEAKYLACNDRASFVTRNLEYNNENDFYWYGQFFSPDSVSECDRGEAMFFTDSGRYYGYFIINDQNYELMDLGEGVQLLALVNSSETNKGICGTSSEGEPQERSTIEREGGYQCKPKILVVYMSEALTSDPMGTGRGLLAFNQTRQAMINSQVGPFQMGLMYRDATAYNYTVPAYSFSNPSFTGMNQALKDVTSINTNINLQMRLLQAHNKADIVILIVPNNPDPIKGIARQLDPPTITNNTAFGVVQVGWATTAGYSFAHEVGHLMGARHADEGAVSAGADYTPSIAHAHRWTWSNTSWGRTYHHTQYTITYQNTAGATNTLLQYSTPNLSNNGQATGTPNNRDAARKFREQGCTIADYNPDPDAFTIGISGNSPSGGYFNGQLINGKNVFCSGRDVVYTAWVTGPTGTYNYYWEYSPNGINYYPANNSGLAWHSDYFAASNIFWWIRLTVTAPNGQQQVAYYPVWILNCSGLWFKKSPTDADKTAEEPSITVVQQESWNIYPNPVRSGEAAVEIQLLETNDVQLQLTDLSARVLKTVAYPKLSAGKSILKLNVSGLATGLYQLVYQKDGKREVKSLSVQN